MVTALCNQSIHWLGLRLSVPEEWQVVRHSLSPARGRLTLVDRYRQRLELNWTRCEREPDVERMLSDDRARQLEHQPDARLESLEAGDWRGTTRVFDESGQAVTRAVRYDAGTGRLLEAVVITTAGPEDLAEAGELLASIAVESKAEEATRWRAFDLDVTTPGGEWRLASTEVKPADVTLAFRQFRGVGDESDKPTGAEATVRRMGMADAWWTGDAARFLRQSWRGAPEVEQTRAGGRTVTRAAGVEPGPRLKRMLGLLREREEAVWPCERCNAVYHVRVLSWRKAAVSVDGFTVACGATAGGCRE